MEKSVKTKGCRRIKYVAVGALKQRNYFEAPIEYIQEKRLFVDTMDSQILYKDKIS